jgi:hypothetical protein
MTGNQPDQVLPNNVVGHHFQVTRTIDLLGHH